MSEKTAKCMYSILYVTDLHHSHFAKRICKNVQSSVRKILFSSMMFTERLKRTRQTQKRSDRTNHKSNKDLIQKKRKEKEKSNRTSLPLTPPSLYDVDSD